MNLLSSFDESSSQRRNVLLTTSHKIQINILKLLKRLQNVNYNSERSKFLGTSMGTLFKWLFDHNFRNCDWPSASLLISKFEEKCKLAKHCSQYYRESILSNLFRCKFFWNKFNKCSANCCACFLSFLSVR